ncbi:aldehyde dehydrogenase [Artomyces pyxidatus]|uniref:Aldehyde dehydrogenase n=1 Tax=Artomyces pyxidatus TaxID=48021 RepID=A0ACB8SFY9_9AGAM|nr:aldehyde dehydrogenase [Artomyces pyxidatus]
MASSLKYTPLEDIPKIHDTVVAKFNSGITRPLAWRRQQLIQLGKMLQENEERLAEAIHIDLGKPRLETTVADIGPVVYGVTVALESLEEWTAPEKPSKLPQWRANWDTTVYKSPKGAVLIITPWNYPYIITLGPLIGVIAAGNTAVIKPSEMVPTVSAALAELIPKYLDPEAFMVVNGAVEETTRLLDLRWDHIFYTGSNRVGRVVATAAAKNVTPVTLELGGKCPVVVDSNTDVELAAKRILYGKQANVGQVCVSPDYVLVHRSKQDEVIAAFQKIAKQFWPEGSLKSPDIGHIISPLHRNRLTGLLEKTNGKIALGGGVEGDKKMEITIVKDVGVNDILMEDEIYGPILAVVPVEDTDEAIRVISSKPSALVVYVFTEDEAVKNKFLQGTASGTLCLNDTYQQLAVHEMPFGGAGESGYGAYLGKTSFDTFSQSRSYVNVPFANEPYMAVRYPPYTDEAVDALASFGMRLPLPSA